MIDFMFADCGVAQEKLLGSFDEAILLCIL